MSWAPLLKMFGGEVCSNMLVSACIGNKIRPEQTIIFLRTERKSGFVWNIFWKDVGLPQQVAVSGVAVAKKKMFFEVAAASHAPFLYLSIVDIKRFHIGCLRIRRLQGANKLSEVKTSPSRGLTTRTGFASYHDILQQRYFQHVLEPSYMK